MMLSSNFRMKNLSLLMPMCLALVFNVALKAAAVPLDEVWQPNGPVYTVEMVRGGGANSAFIGGDFTYVGPESGNAVAVSSTAPNHTLFDLTFTGGAGADIGVHVAIASDNGGWYIGGNFTQVIDSSGSQNRNNLAEIDADGKVLAWNPDVNGVVRTLLLDTVNGMLYVGGDFTQVNGVIMRNYLAAFDISNNTLASWNPNANGPVHAMVLGNASESLYVGGSFARIGSQATQPTRNNIAHFNLLIAGSEDVATDWNPDVNDIVRTLLLDAVNNRLYAGGDFTEVNGGAISRNYLAAFDTTGNANNDLGWNPDADGGIVRTLALLGNLLYIGGDFSTINGASWPGFAVSDVSDLSLVTIVAWSGNQLPFSGAEEASISVSQIIVAGGRIYVASNGELDTDSSNRAVSRMAVLNSGTGAVSWSSDASGGLINTIAVADDQIFVAGTFESGGGRIRSNIAELDLSTSTSRGMATEWDVFVNGPVYSIASTSNGQGVYIGGQFSVVVSASTPRNNMALLSASSNNVSVWNPSITGGAGAKVRALAFSPDDTTLYAGGLFSQVAGQSRNNIAALDLTVEGIDGLGVLNGSSAIGSIDGVAGEVHALVVSSDGELVFVGGDYIRAGGHSNVNIAALKTGSGMSLADIPPDDLWAVANVNGIVRSLALSSDDKTLYFGGDFTSITEENATTYPRNRVAALEVDPISNKWRVTTDDPNVTNGTGIYSLAFSTDDDMLWLGGNFSNVTVSNTPRNHVARLNLAETPANDLTEWNPDISTGTVVYAMKRNTDDSLMIVGGDFNTVGNAPATARNNLAVFDTARPTVTNHVAGSFYNTPSLDVVLSCTHNSTAGPCTIFYTLDGTEPKQLSALSAIYVQPPPAPPEPPPPPRIDVITADAEVKFFAKDAHGTVSEINSANYGIDGDFPTTTAQPNIILKDILHGDGYMEVSDTGIEIALVCEDSGGANCGNTYYTTDGSAPNDGDGTPSKDAQLYILPLTPKQLLPLDSYTLDDLVGAEQDIFEEMTLADIVSSVEEARFRIDLTKFTLADIPPVAVARNSIELQRVLEYVDLAAVRIDSIPGNILANVVASANIPDGAETFADIDLEDLDLNQITLGSISRTAYSLADIPASDTPPPTYITASQVPLIQRVLGGEDNRIVLDAVRKKNITLEQIPAEFIPRTRLYGFIELKFFSIDRAGNSEADSSGSGVKSEIYYVDIGAPETTATPNTEGNVFTSEIHVVLECYDYGDTPSGFSELPPGVTTAATGSGCRESSIYYTIGGGVPTPSEVGTGGATQVYTGPIPISSASVIRFLSIDELGNEEVSGFEVYAFTFSSVGRSGVGASGFAVWLFALYGLLLRWRSMRTTMH
ncbi:MAG: chitobiase/beta-hexosaminidase C-terminal domain-containing protein [Gammaproteobacteria bacterium]|nr:chitobiase/beta-hexosaminidase C-terminal domain-containing protein [Gammaproteobacteria bacterium]